MSNLSVQKFMSAAALSALALMTEVGCSSNSGSMSTLAKPAASKPGAFNPLVSIESSESAGIAGIPMSVRSYSIVDESRVFTVSLNDTAEGSTANASKDGNDYRVSDACQGLECSEIAVTMTRNSGGQFESRAFLFAKTGEGKYAQVCTLPGLAADPNIAIAGLMSRCSHDSALSPKATAALAQKKIEQAAPAPSSK